ncbi:MAG: GNAT family N-acetyltransferase, partial [Thermoproteota archaeon]
LIENLRKKNSEEVLRLGLFDSSGKIHGGVSLYASEWDIQHFGIKIGKADFLLFDESVELYDRLKFLMELNKQLSNSKLQVIFLRHTLSDYKTIIALSKAGWTLADVLLTFHRSLENLPSLSSRGDLLRIREACIDDSNTIGNLARISFRISHFHTDPDLPHALSDELYAKWSISSLNDPSSKVFIAEESNATCGFITCSIKSLIDKVRYGVIDLIAVDQNKQRRGIGKFLLTKALEWFSLQVSSVYVGTQATNTPAVRLYESMGFKLVDSEITFHFWISR